MNFMPLKSSSAASLYVVESGDRRLLIDAGLSGKKLKGIDGFRLRDMDACLITHAHKDHSRGVNDVLKAAIDCYMSRPTADFLKLRGHRVHTVDPMKAVVIAGFSVFPFSVPHDCPGTLGFCISADGERLVFVTDAAACQYRFAGVDLYAMECNYSLRFVPDGADAEKYERNVQAHMSLEACAEYFRNAELSRTRRIYLLHLSDGYSREDFFKREIEAASGVPVTVCEK